MNERVHSKGKICAAILTMIGSMITAVSVASAQTPAAPPPPPPVWAGSLGAGLAVTSGNADTSNFNVNFALTHDPANPHVVKADAVFLRGSSEGETIVNRSTFGIRDEYALSERTALFGQFRYLRDTFKLIDYLMAPTFGISQKLVLTPKALLAADAGVGFVVEKNPGFARKSSGALTLGENFAYKISETATFTQHVNGLWKMNDLEDALYTAGIGLAARVSDKITLKLELLEAVQE